MHLMYLIFSLILFFQQQPIEQPRRHQRIRLSALLNCSYYISDFWETVKLHGGHHKRKVDIFDCTLNLIGQSWGDLDGDGAEDALVVLEGWCGGNTSDTYVIPVLNRNGTPTPMKPLAVPMIGKVVALNVRKGVVILVFTSEAQKFTERYRLKGGQLEHVD